MIVEQAANWIAKAIYHRLPDQSSSVPVLRYGLIIIFNTIFTVTLSLIGGALTGRLADTALVLLVFALLRSISGGYHFNTSLPCTLLTVSTAVILPYITLTFTVYLVLAGLSLLLFVIFSPSNLAKQSRIPAAYYPYLKFASIVLVTLGLWMQRDVITLSIFVQAVSLVHVWEGGADVIGSQNHQVN